MKLKIGSTYQKAVTIVEKLKEGNASIFICGKSGVGKSTLSYNITRGLLESGVRIVAIDHRHAVSLPVELEPYVHRQDVSQEPLKLHLFGAGESRRAFSSRDISNGFCPSDSLITDATVSTKDAAASAGFADVPNKCNLIGF